MKLLIPERTIPVLPGLAKEVGLNEAIVLQQLWYWTDAGSADEHGEVWVYNTIAEWRDQFPWLSSRTLQRIFERLEDRGLVEIRQPGGSDRTNHYRLILEAVPHSVSVASSTRQADVFSNTTESTHRNNNASSSSPTSSNEIDEVAAHYVAVMKPRREPGAEERKVIAAALKVATVEECCEAITKCAASDWHMKRGEHSERTGGKHNQLSKILKGRRGKETTRERIDFWLELDVGGAPVDEDDLDPDQVRREQGLE